MSGLQIFWVNSPISVEFLESAHLKTLVLAALGKLLPKTFDFGTFLATLTSKGEVSKNKGQKKGNNPPVQLFFEI